MLAFRALSGCFTSPFEMLVPRAKQEPGDSASGLPELLISMSAIEVGGVFPKAAVERGRVHADPRGSAECRNQSRLMAILSCG